MAVLGGVSIRYNCGTDVADVWRRSFLFVRRRSFLSVWGRTSIACYARLDRRQGWSMAACDSSTSSRHNCGFDVAGFWGRSILFVWGKRFRSLWARTSIDCCARLNRRQGCSMEVRDGVSSRNNCGFHVADLWGRSILYVWGKRFRYLWGRTSIDCWARLDGRQGWSMTARDIATSGLHDGIVVADCSSQCPVESNECIKLWCNVFLWRRNRIPVKSIKKWASIPLDTCISNIQYTWFQ